MNQLITEAIKMQKAWEYLRQNGALSLHNEGNRVCIQLRLEAFRKRFPRYIMEERSKEYPYKLKVWGDDILFFAIASEAELAEVLP